MPQSYTPEFKKKIVRLHEEEGSTYKSITAEYGVVKSSISKWCTELRRECLTSPEVKEEYDSMKELLKVKKENEELRKEVAFLKKAAAFFAKEIIERRFQAFCKTVLPNEACNYYRERKCRTQREILLFGKLDGAFNVTLNATILC